MKEVLNDVYGCLDGVGKNVQIQSTFKNGEGLSKVGLDGKLSGMKEQEE